jgi:hypothetical protein
MYLHWGEGSSFTSPYIGKTGPYDPPMSVCTKVMSKGVHNIVFSVMPDVEHPRTLQNHSHVPDKSYAQHLMDIVLCTY